jgi:hypothetical protein
VRRVPLLAGSRVVVANASDDAVVITPPPPGEGLADVAAAVRDALRFPLAGQSLEKLVRRGGTATIVVEPPSLPVPGSTDDPRMRAIAATVAELAAAGVPVERQTLLIAGGLARRLGPADVGGLVEPEFRRRFRGRVVVHDAEDADLVDLGLVGSTPLRVNRALVDTDLVVVVSAAESVLHGGPAALLSAGCAPALRAAGAYSLLETAASNGWRLANALERELSKRVPLIGISLVLDQPRVSGAVRGFPYDPEAVERLARNKMRFAFNRLPGPLRMRLLRSLPARLGATAAYAGPPSVAHAEALLRAVEQRSAHIDEPVDALVMGIPGTTPHLPRERPNPLLVSYLGLALALRLWRDAFPIRDGGTLVIVSRFDRHFSHPTQQPYRAFFGAVRFGREPEDLHDAERAVVADARLLDAYRAGDACHPLLPFADWEACQPALGRLGSVLVAGCRDAYAARQLGFVPVHSLPAALDMARGMVDGHPRVGFLLSPPYFPLRVGGG